VAAGALARRLQCGRAWQLGAVRESSGGSAGLPQLWDGGDVREGEGDGAQPSRLPVSGEKAEATR
jgi:hypothetical protein